MDSKPETKKALAAKAADAQKAVALKAAGLSANATAAEVVRLFKSTAADVEKLTREGMRKLAELAALLVEGYGLTQEQVAEKVGRSQPWVSGVLRWRRDGYEEVAFGPETRSAPKLLAANNNSGDASHEDGRQRGNSDRCRRQARSLHTRGQGGGAACEAHGWQRCGQ